MAKRRLLTAVPRVGEGWVEALVLPVLGLLLGWMVSPKDPLLVYQPFPWLLLIPLLIALRYEFMPALLSIAVLGTVFFWHAYPMDTTIEYAAGFLLVALIAGEYAGYWARQEQGKVLQEEIASTRLHQLTDDLYTTQISLDRLEQSLLYQPVSVRSVLGELRGRIAETRGEVDSRLAQNFLYFLNQLSGVQIASFYRLGNGDAPELLASFGATKEWYGDDRIWKNAVKTCKSQTLADLEITQIQHYISVHVYKDGRGQCHVLAIEDLSFFSISKENLQVIEVVFQYLCRFGDSYRKGLEILELWPDCPAEFAADFIQLQSLCQDVPRSGIVLNYTFRACDASERIIEKLQRLRRGMDLLWIHRVANTVQVIVLLPFAGTAAAEGHYVRMQSEIQQCYSHDWEEGFLQYRLFPIGEESVQVQVRRFLDMGTVAE